MLTFLFGLFVLAAACYLLFLTSDPLEQVGGRIGELLHLPEDVIASTFQAAATSGPEIVMAIVAATPFIASNVWDSLQLGERACSGALNMAFSAMDNLLGIGCLGIIFMIYKKTISRDETVKVEPSVMIGLIFYVVASGSLCLFITTSLHRSAEGLLVSTLTEWQSWWLMAVGIAFVVSQFFVSPLLARREAQRQEDGPVSSAELVAVEEEGAERLTVTGWFRSLGANAFIYLFLIFGLVVFVRECLSATFNMATVGIVSVGGVLIMFTSYVSSFPEFMMTYRYAVANKKSELLGMLFGSNVIDLAFAGFRSIWLREPMDVYTTGRVQELFPVYLWCLPIGAVIALIGLSTGKLKFRHAYPLMVFYIIYIVSGFILL